MTTIATARPTIQRPEPEHLVDEAQLAAAAFLARYSGRTLDAYRHDLRGFFQWAADNGVAVLARDPPPHRAVPRPRWTTRPGRLDDRPAALDGVRLLPVRAHRRPDRVEPGPVRPPPTGPPLRRPRPGPLRARRVPVHRRAATTATTPRSPCCSASTGCGSAKRAPPTSRTSASNEATAPCASSARATSPPPSRSCPAPRAPSTSPSANATRARSCADATASASTGAPRTGGSRSIGKRAGLGRGPPPHAPSRVHHGRPRRRRAAPRRPDRRPPRRPPNHHHLRPATRRTSTATPPTSSSPSSPAADTGHSLKRHFGHGRRAVLAERYGTPERDLSAGHERDIRPSGSVVLIASGSVTSDETVVRPGSSPAREARPGRGPRR